MVEDIVLGVDILGISLLTPTDVAVFPSTDGAIWAICRRQTRRIRVGCSCFIRWGVGTKSVVREFQQSQVIHFGYQIIVILTESIYKYSRISRFILPVQFLRRNECLKILLGRLKLRRSPHPFKIYPTIPTLAHLHTRYTDSYKALRA